MYYCLLNHQSDHTWHNRMLEDRDHSISECMHPNQGDQSTCGRIKSCLPIAQIIYTSLIPNNLQIQYFKFKIKPIKNHNLNQITNGFRENFPEMFLIVYLDLSDIMAMVISHGYDILDGQALM